MCIDTCSYYNLSGSHSTLPVPNNDISVLSWLNMMKSWLHIQIPQEESFYSNTNMPRIRISPEKNGLGEQLSCVCSGRIAPRAYRGKLLTQPITWHLKGEPSLMPPFDQKKDLFCGFDGSQCMPHLSQVSLKAVRMIVHNYLVFVTSFLQHVLCAFSPHSK